MLDRCDAARFLKVNHAGEHGAVSIYSGQMLIARLTSPALLPTLAAFKVHEQTHRTIFGKELRRRGIARCKSYWLCALGGYTLGVVSALLGVQAIASTTVSVERVVLRHLAQQLQILGDSDAAASAAIAAIVQDEQAHHDQFASHIRHDRFLNKVVDAVVSAMTERVIHVGMRI